ncbi:MAG: 2-acyl-glycerophospho-ethanolamine acyltransferase, partial [Firmicutes bacterium]|nr:2-acyl-glycerophospho-ethanolamine acyltransferase [Bacillota bacterium]
LKAALQILVARLIVFWIDRGGRHIHIERSAMNGIKPPYIVLANHTSNFDPALVQVAIGDDACRFMTSNYYFRLPLIGYVLRKWGVIPKIQFSPDLRALRGALNVLAHGGVVGIFPEGRRSVDGGLCDFPLSLARFLQKAQVAVVVVNIDGGYFLWPRWAKKWRSARVEVSVQRLFTLAELQACSEQEIHDWINRGLAYNDYRWLNNAGAKLISPPSTEGLHKILHHCPRCLAQRVMQSKKNRLFCLACQNSAHQNEYGKLEPQDENCVAFADPVQWNAWQRAQQSERIQRGQADFRATVSDLRVADKYRGGYRRCGRGELVLQQAGLTFSGVIDGQDAELFFPIAHVPAISTEFGFDFEICDATHAWWFFLLEAQQTIILDTLISIYHEKYGAAL